MSLFEVPGWSLPTAPVAQQSKKRKRAPVKEKDADDVDQAQMIKAAQKNIEKLMQSLGTSTDALEEGDSGRSTKKQRPSKDRKAKGVAAEPEEAVVREVKKSTKQEKGKGKGRDKSAGKNTSAVDSVKSLQSNEEPLQKKQKHKQPQKPKPKHKAHDAEPTTAHSDAEPSKEAIIESPPHPRDADPLAPKKSAKRSSADTQQGLTTLQTNMKKSLDGARFRWINEMLYKSESAKARELMSSDPAVFADYHTGFRHQVESWPTNPVSHYISTLSSYPAKTVVADLGCGDAALARSLVPKGIVVLSFDLVSDDAYVIAADTCDRVPLPGSERSLSASSDHTSEEDGEGQVVDVVVCALSLMGTNWPGCIREAWRILKAGGELKIAEVASRFASVDDFTSFVCSFGFKLASKDERNSHFALFEFKKVPRKPKGEKEWTKLMGRGSILKPCEYKRR